jgi:predicted metal-dependent HD superfamily phosphohydrolase
MDPYLRHRWFELCNRESIPAKMEMWQAIVLFYDIETRAYHNLDHIASCLKQLDEWPNEVPERSAVEVAIWFHDIIFDTRRSDNEINSAGLAKHYLGDHPLAESVFELILATRHSALQMLEQEYILCDIDLSILGSSEQTYNHYAKGVESEFSWVPKDRFYPSRIRVLNSFLSREYIYYTDHYREIFEAPARANITREISEMKMRFEALDLD